MSNFNVNGKELEVGTVFLYRGRKDRKYKVVTNDGFIFEYKAYSIDDEFFWNPIIKCTEFPDTFQTLKPGIYFPEN